MNISQWKIGDRTFFFSRGRRSAFASLYECPCRGTPAPPPVVPEDGALGVEETLPAAAWRHAHQLALVQQRREVHLAVAAHPAVRHAGGVFDI